MRSEGDFFLEGDLKSISDRLPNGMQLSTIPENVEVVANFLAASKTVRGNVRVEGMKFSRGHVPPGVNL